MKVISVRLTVMLRNIACVAVRVVVIVSVSVYVSRTLSVMI